MVKQTGRTALARPAFGDAIPTGAAGGIRTHGTIAGTPDFESLEGTGFRRHRAAFSGT